MIAILALEERVVLQAHQDVQVARRPPLLTRGALAHPAQSLPIGDPGRDVDLEHLVST